MSDTKTTATNRAEPGFATRAIHAGQEPDERTGAVNVPLYMSSTFVQQSPGEHKGWEYSRTANPTRDALEACMASLEAARFGFACASGCAATTTVAHLLKAGDHVVAGDDMYGGTYRLFEQVIKNNGIDFSYVDLGDPTNLKNAMRENTKMVWAETPTNPLLRLVDLKAISNIAKAHNALLVADNTFMSPYLQRPIEHGADLVVHSTTKYIGGHSDMVGGIIVTDNEELAERLAFLSNSMGGVQSNFDAWLTMRSLKTLAVRMRTHQENATALAQWLEAHPRVERVIYPGLQSHPQYELAQRQMDGPGGMITFFIEGGMDAARHFLERVEVFSLAESLGGVESLIEHPAIMTHASIPADIRATLGITDNLIRLSVGIEDLDDLRNDLANALDV
jgi:cystathionine gamma-lyase